MPAVGVTVRGIKASTLRGKRAARSSEALRVSLVGGFSLRLGGTVPRQVSWTLPPV